MSVNAVDKQRIQVDGVSENERDASATAAAAGRDELPATLRGLVESALSSAATARIPEKAPDEPIQVEPVTPLRTIIVGAGVILLLALIARFVL